MKRPRILIVDDEIDMLEVCQDALQKLNVEVVTESKSANAVRRLKEELWDVLLADLKMPEMDGISLLKVAREVSPETVVCILTGYPTIETAVEAVKLGAFEYITKPFTPDQLQIVVQRLLEQKFLKEENLFLTRQVEKRFKFDNIIGNSPAMLSIFDTIEKVSVTDSDVLIVGESGTGKELVARSIHQHSLRKDHRFVPIDCGAIPESLLESELFGHERGAFTGAHSTSLGLLEFAHKGTLFLDEICELHPVLQAKLLRTLQERQIRRVGGKDVINVDIRIIAATNKEIEAEVKEKRFREDLYYRINVVKIKVPPLRERVEDIPLLVDHFLKRYSKEWKKDSYNVDNAALDILCRYQWPGNVRELQNVLKRSVVLTKNNLITPDDLQDELIENVTESQTSTGQEGFFQSRTRHIANFEKKYFQSLLAKHKGNVTDASGEANIPRWTFYRLIKKHGLSQEDFKQ